MLAERDTIEGGERQRVYGSSLRGLQPIARYFSLSMVERANARQQIYGRARGRRGGLFSPLPRSLLSVPWAWPSQEIYPSPGLSARDRTMSGGPKTVGRWWKDWKERKKEVSDTGGRKLTSRPLLLVDGGVRL